MFKKISKTLIASTILCAAFATQAAPKLLNQTVAVVNNSIITMRELDQTALQAKIQMQQTGVALPDSLSLKRQVLQQLIMQKVAMELAKVNNITASDKEVKDTIARIAKAHNMSVANLKASLMHEGVNYQDYLNSIRKQIVINRLEQKAVANNIVVTPDEISQYLKLHRNKSTQQKEYKVSHILIAFPDDPTPIEAEKIKQKALNVVKKIKAGENFSKAAATYSQSGDALSGGSLGWKKLDELPNAFVPIVKALKKGQTSAPVKTAGGYSIVKLDDIRSPKTKKHTITEYHLRQILIKTSPVMSDVKAKSLLTRLRTAVLNGQSFAKLASTNSQNYAVSEKGGDLGWVTLNNLPTQISRNVQKLSKNKITQPFKIQDGWQIIQLLGKREKDNTANFERFEAQRILFNQKATQALQAWQSKIRSEAYVKILVPELQP